MGKGGGCVPSKKKHPHIDDDVRENPTAAPLVVDDQIVTDTDTATTTSVVQSSSSTLVESRKLRIFIVFYSMYGHVDELAKRIKVGVDGVEGVEAVLLHVPETLQKEVLDNMKAPSKDSEISEIAAASELVEANVILFGFPTRYGCMAAQMNAFFYSTGQLWKEQKVSLD